MSMTTPSEAHDRLLALIKDRAGQYSGVKVQALVFNAKPGGDASDAPYFVRFTLMPRGGAVAEFDHQYPDVRLFQRTISIDELRQTLNDFLLEKRLSFCGLKYSLDPQRSAHIDERDLVSSAEMSESMGWAHNSFWVQLRNGGVYPHAPLIAGALPAFPHAFVAARALFGIDLMDHSGRQGYMNVVVPNYSARIVSVTAKGKAGMECSVEVGSGDLQSLGIKGWSHQGKKDQNFAVDELRRAKVKLGIPQKSDAFVIWLVDKKTNEIVDFRNVDRRLTPVPRPATDFSEDSLRTLIKNGENERVEHKEADPKRPAEPFNVADIAKEIVAFANHEGGMIFLGVRDDCDIIGVDEPARLRDWVSTVAAQNCKPPVNVQYKACTVDGKRIGVVVVPRGAPGVPYQRNDGKTFVRRCASSRPADPHEIQQLAQMPDSDHGGFR